MLEQGERQSAEDAYRRAVDLNPQNAGAWVNLGFVLSARQQFAEAKIALEHAVGIDGFNEDALYLLGSVDLALNELLPAITHLSKALSVRPDFEICRRELCLAHVRQGDLESAKQVAAKGLEIDPQSGALHHIMGNLHGQSGALKQATASYRIAVSLLPDTPHVHANLAKALQDQGQLSEAMSCYQRALHLAPEMVEALLGMGALQHKLGNAAEAVQTYRRALAVSPDYTEVLNNLAAALTDLRLLSEASDILNRAIRLDPHHVGAHVNLGIVLNGQGDLAGAAASYRRALALNPQEARAHANLGSALQEMGEHDSAITSYRTALLLQPEYADAQSNLLFTLNYHPDQSAQEIFAAYRDFDKQMSLRLRGPWRGHTNTRDRSKRLKVGYVSPDFRQHSVRHFLEPLLAHHDKHRVEVFAYAELSTEDAMTVRYRGYVDHWVPTIGLSDEALAQRIRSDGVDILIDLAGHTAKNRLGVFALKPAPVSISWLGFGYTTGLSAIDYMLTDGASAPHGSEELFAEQPWRLATPGYVYRPADSMGEVNVRPAHGRGFITFGTLTRSVRINHRSVRVWSQILQRVPSSRLVIDSGNYRDAQMRSVLLSKFAAHGIGPERLEIGFHSPPWDVLRSMDIGLDCFPHNSGTTLFESLYMGVPFVTLAGRPSVGRLGSSILQGVGHPEWIAHSEDEYADLVVALASDLPKLAALRANLRSQMQGSALMDEAGFARKVEAAYREMFSRWAAPATPSH